MTNKWWHNLQKAGVTLSLSPFESISHGKRIFPYNRDFSYNSQNGLCLRIHWRLFDDFKNKQQKRSVWGNAFWYLKVYVIYSESLFKTLYIETKQKYLKNSVE